MDRHLENLIIKYITGNDIQEVLSDKSKDRLKNIISDLLSIYANDKNSSTLREMSTVKLSGYEHFIDKHGYDGFKHIDDKIIFCEAKPKNITLKTDYSESKQHFNGDGAFKDYTYERLLKDKEENPNMLVSGFINGIIVYIIEFPFIAIYNRLEAILPKEREKGTYKSRAYFTYEDYALTEIKLNYKNQALMEKYQWLFNKKFYSFLISKCTDQEKPLETHPGAQETAPEATIEVII